MSAVTHGHAEASITYQRGVTEDRTPYLVVHGEFEYLDRIDAFLTEVTEHKPAFVTFNSPGGSLVTGMKLGRAIRASGLNTIQVKDKECSSACAVAFLGGVNRMATAGSIGVHKNSFANSAKMNVDDAVSATQAATADLIGYFKEMGVDVGLLQLSMQYESWDIRYLSLSEMVEYGVINLQQDNPNKLRLKSPDREMAAAPATTARPDANPLEMPAAKTGQVRHPRGAITLLATPDENGVGVARLPNRAHVQILDDRDRWYRVMAGAFTGYVHHTWIKVDQFHPSPFEGRFVQIRSFDNYADAEAYVRSSSLPLTAFLTSNGWFAITLDGAYEDVRAKQILHDLKGEQRIPGDSYRTYGNTYVRKICCD